MILEYRFCLAGSAGYRLWGVADCHVFILGCVVGLLVG